jgi:hypothetical protein
MKSSATRAARSGIGAAQRQNEQALELADWAH